MLEQIKAVNNPLTIIAIFAGLAEVASIIALKYVSSELQYIFIWFVMSFPVLLVLLFFGTLIFKPRVLYAPSDFKNEDNFLNTLGVVKQDLTEISNQLQDVSKDIVEYDIKELKGISETERNKLSEIIEKRVKEIQENISQTENSVESTRQILKGESVNLEQTLDEITQNIIKMYDSHHKPFLLEYEEMRLIVTANSLKKRKGKYDDVVLTLKFRTGEHRVFCHEVGLKSGNDTFLLERVSFEVSDKDGNDVETFYILSSSSRLIIFFKDALPPNDGPYKIICRTSVNDFVSDNKLSLRSTRASGTTDNVELVLKVPKEQNIGLENSKEKDAPQGREMTKPELVYFDIPNGFEVMGWKTNNLNPGEVFLVNMIHR